MEAWLIPATGLAEKAMAGVGAQAPSFRAG